MINIKEFIEKYQLDESVINIILNVGLISSFIAIFYFRYVCGVEKNIIELQSEILTTDLMSSIIPILSDNDKIKFKNNLRVPDLSNEDEQSLKYNQNIKNDAYTNIIIIFGICILSSLLCYMYFAKPGQMSYIYTIGINLIMLIIVGLTEFTFTNIVPVNYITADPNYIKYTILSKLHDKFILPSWM